MKTAVVDVGGGLRGIYAAGVFDRCLLVPILIGSWKRISGFMQEWEYLPEAPTLLPILQDKKAETIIFTQSTLSGKTT